MPDEDQRDGNERKPVSAKKQQGEGAAAPAGARGQLDALAQAFGK